MSAQSFFRWLTSRGKVAVADAVDGSSLMFENYGYCNCCDTKTRFVADNSWFRDFYLCSNCGCIPRERALMYAIEKFLPHWRDSVIHESSPAPRGASLKLSKEARQYIPSQYRPEQPVGALFNGVRCENLEQLTFADESIDLHVTQDVFEHLFSPDKAFQEIARTLRPGGMHIATIPLENGISPTEVSATFKADGTIEYLLEPVYHGNPIGDNRSLVTRKWGYDIVDYIYLSSGMTTTILYLDILDLGIRAELIEVIVSRK